MSVGRIQRVPRGLLQFLGMVGTGSQPVDMANEVRTTLELLPFYGKDVYETVGVTAATNVSAIGDVSELVVPNNEAWLMLSGQYSLQATTTGDACSLSFRITAAGRRSRIHSFHNLKTAVDAGAVLLEAFPFPQPIVLTAGNAIQAVVDDISLAAGTRELRVFATVYRFPI